MIGAVTTPRNVSRDFDTAPRPAFGSERLYFVPSRPLASPYIRACASKLSRCWISLATTLPPVPVKFFCAQATCSSSDLIPCASRAGSRI